MTRRHSLKTPQNIGDVLQHALRNLGIPLYKENRNIINLWEQSVGPQIASQTHPDSLKRGTLFVKTANPGWTQQLQFLKQEIIKKINSLAGKEVVTNIYFSIGALPQQQPVGNSNNFLMPVESYPLGKRDLNLIEKSTGIIADEELRILLKRLMTKDIIRRRFILQPKKDL